MTGLEIHKLLGTLPREVADGQIVATVPRQCGHGGLVVRLETVEDVTAAQGKRGRNQLLKTLAEDATSCADCKTS